MFIEMFPPWKMNQLEEGSQAEHDQAQRCRVRLEHLESAEGKALEWNSIRLKRILVDYMLRMSYYDTATKLTESSDIEVYYQNYNLGCQVIYILFVI